MVPVEDTEISESESVENQDSEEEAVEFPFTRPQGTEELTILYASPLRDFHEIAWVELS